MKPFTVTLILIRVLALFWLGNGLANVVPTLGAIFSSGILQFVGLVLFSLPQLMVGGLLWKYSPRISALITRDTEVQVEGEIISIVVGTRIAVALLGIWVLSSAFPELLSQLYALWSLKSALLTNDVQNFNTSGNNTRLLGSLLRAVFGLVLLIGRQRIAQFISEAKIAAQGK